MKAIRPFNLLILLLLPAILVNAIAVCPVQAADSTRRPETATI